MSSLTVTYTSISSDYEEPSNTGSPGVVVPGPEHPPSPDYVPEPEYPEHLVPSDAEAPMEDQPLPDDASPAALSSGYIADSDPKEDPADYPADGGDDDDDESSDDDDDDESFDDDDDDDDDDDVEEDGEEEEEHLAPTDSSIVPAIDPVPSVKDTEAFEADESAPTPVPSPRRRTARMSIRPQIPMSDTAEALIAEIRLRATSSPTHHPSEIPSPPLLLPSTTHRDDLPEADMPLQKRACFTAPTGRFEVRESSSTVATMQAGHTLAHIVDYGFIDTMDASIHVAESRAMTAVGVVNDRVTDLSTTQRQDAQELYRIRDEDRLTAHIQYEHDMFRDLVRAAEAGPYDGPEDAGSSC
ncbi:hypothetical protein Tco_1227906 [Tanacetum coccineum]